MGEGFLNDALVKASYAVLPEEGEDSFAAYANDACAMLCVTDGCGGLGARRYARLEGHTGAFLAARLAARAFEAWALSNRSMPLTPDEGEALRLAAQGALDAAFGAFDQEYALADARIVGSMQRRLPTTLCAALSREGAATWREVCFLWAGDSRGYVLDGSGLHQCTADHLRGEPDAFLSLYRDAALSRFLSADAPSRLSMRRLRAPLPCVLLVATDGAFGCLPTPMEFEMLLLSALQAARSLSGWERKLTAAFARLCQDDATVLLMPCGFESFAQMKAMFAQRREALKGAFITPVRRRRHDRDFARARWEAYREGYDWTRGGRYERADWRI